VTRSARGVARTAAGIGFFHATILPPPRDGEPIRRHVDVERDLEDAEAILAMAAKYKDSTDPQTADAYRVVFLLMEEVRQSCLRKLGWSVSRNLGHRTLRDSTDGAHGR
jgi:hypothetical protein